MRIAILNLAILILAPLTTFAAPYGAIGSSVHQSILQSPDQGLCMNTSINQNSPQITQGYCQQLANNLSSIPSCLAAKVEQLRQNALNGNPPAGINDYCGNWLELAGDPVKWQNMILNYVSAIFNEESHWNAGAINPTAVSYTGQHAKGICQLSVSSVQAYSCGCSDIKSDQDIYDAKKSLTCGADVALTNMVKTNAMGGGQSGNSVGAAAYFEPVRSSSDKREKIVSKMNYYCSSSGSNLVAQNTIPNPNIQTAVDYTPLFQALVEAASAAASSHGSKAATQ